MYRKFHHLHPRTKKKKKKKKKKKMKFSDKNKQTDISFYISARTAHNLCF